MRAGELFTKLTVEIEYKGDPRVLEYIEGAANRRFRYVALIGSWLIALGICAAAMCLLGSCSRARAAAAVPAWPQPSAFGRSDAEKEASAVRVESLCVQGDPWGQMVTGQGGWGSGVIYANETVYTAYHVVECPPKSARLIHVVTPDGAKHWAELAAARPDHDIARLFVPDLKNTSPISIRIPTTHEQVCIASAHPERRLRCGNLTEVRPFKTESNGTVDIWHEVETKRGNSGAGIYDLHGYLIGITTNLRSCGDPALELCGLATSLAGRAP